MKLNLILDRSLNSIQRHCVFWGDKYLGSVASMFGGWISVSTTGAACSLMNDEGGVRKFASKHEAAEALLVVSKLEWFYLLRHKKSND